MLLTLHLPPLSPATQDQLKRLDATSDPSMYSWALKSLLDLGGPVSLEEDLVDLLERVVSKPTAAALFIEWVQIARSRKQLKPLSPAAIEALIEHSVHSISTAVGFELLAREFLKPQVCLSTECVGPIRRPSTPPLLMGAKFREAQ